MKMSRIEMGIRTTLAFYEAFNGQDAAGMAALLSDECVMETAVPGPDGRVYSGKEAIADCYASVFQASPAARLELEEVFGPGLRCVARWRLETGEVGETVRGVDIMRIKGDLICEILSYVKA